MSQLANAEIIIVGGGAIGCGAAYSLANAGKTDILLLERAPDIAQVTTSQGAGLCGQVRSNAERIRLAMHSVATFRELQKDAQAPPDWHEVGSLRIALNDKRAGEFRELERECAKAKLEVALLDHKEAKRRWPLMDFREAKAVLWCASDGYMTPQRVAKAYEHQCRKLGVRFAMSMSVEGIVCQNGRVEAVQTNHGRLECKYLINAAGAHAYHVAKLVGLDLPIVPVRHEYFVTGPMDGLTPDLPCFRIPDLTLYGRVRDGGLLLGGWEPTALRTDPRSYPLEGTLPTVNTDWKVLETFETSFRKIFPTAKQLQKQTIGKGWPTFTPDGRFIIGEAREPKGFVMAGGCNAHGISGSAGIGRLLVESLFDPNPSEYVQSLSPNRFIGTKWNWAEACVQAQRVYETYYA